MTKLRHLLAAFSFAAALVGCWITETIQPNHGDRGEIRRATAVRIWHVLVDGAIEGEVVLFHADDQPADAHYVVRNVWQQDMGLVDSVGRAYRFAPHAEESIWVGTGTVAQGVSRILQLGVDCTLVEVGIDFLPVPASSPVPPPRQR